MYAQLIGEFLQARPDGVDIGNQFRLGLTLQFVDAHGNQHAVDGAPLAVFFQQANKALPGLGVGHTMAVLGGIAAGGINQHGLIRKPPVAVPGSTDTFHTATTEFVFQRKIQSGIHQRSGFARTRRPDQNIPGQIVQIIVAVAALLAVTAFENVHRFLETGIQYGYFAVHLFEPGNILCQSCRQLLIALFCLQIDAQVVKAPQQQQHHDDQHASDFARQNPLICHCDVRATKPHQDTERDHANQRNQPVVLFHAVLALLLLVHTERRPFQPRQNLLVFFRQQPGKS